MCWIWKYKWFVPIRSGFWSIAILNLYHDLAIFVVKVYFFLKEWINSEHIFCLIWIKWQHADVKINPMFSATSTVSNCWLSTGSLLPVSQSKRTMCIFIWNWVTRTRFGLHTWSASNAPSICDNGPWARRTSWNVVFPWCGGSSQIMQPTATLCYWFDQNRQE